VARLRKNDGFLMVELLVAMFVLTVALTSLVAVFSTGILTMRRASRVTTATFLADAQMETYRAMTSRDIGIDLAAGTVSALDSNYKNDAACANASTSKTCATNGVGTAETGPTGATPDTCTTINTWYSSTLPCTPSRTISSTTTPASPDGRSYRIDTYIIQVAASGSQRTQKQVTVVVRDSAKPSGYFVRDTSTFDCSTGVTPNSTDC
jgi:type II secretory pathway pseudopilin PulG